MSNGKISKCEFIEAYQWMYGTSKMEAEYIWKVSTYDYKRLFMEAYIELITYKPYM